ncbi:hypothetical protein EG328_008019 [Venturia inaequalis]|uniref:RRM domain-containing protein n=1 Tax=Venturia inaequalis TaxID=5025 RepID=A0A8H3UEH2_VENIN|nr:hypothetical protein EG328_008019 [Venturia inaequalis]
MSVEDSEALPDSPGRPKKKQEKMSLGDFLGDQSLGSWADEMEDAPIPCGNTGYGGGERRAFSSAGAFGGGSSGGGGFTGGERAFTTREELPLPTKPPYTSHLGNLPFDATNGDIDEFFAGCEVTSIRIVEDKLDRKPKGFGYVEFGSLDGLKKALELNGTPFQGRGIRISVADPPKGREDGGREVDWTRRGPLPDLPREQNQRRVSERTGGFGGGGYEAAPGMERGGSRRGANFAPEGDRAPPRDMSNMSWERRGPLSPVPGAAPVREGRPRNNDAPRERRNEAAWGEGQARSEAAGSQEGGSRPPRERPQAERAPTAADMDNQWRSKMKPDAPVKSDTPTPEPSAPSSPAQAAAPAQRPRLNLAKRTVSEAQPAQASASSDAKASPFGAARAVDTATREREVEEKRQSAIREKKEADEKARAAKITAQKAEKQEGSENEIAEGEKENGDAPKPSFSILQHDDAGDKDTGDEGSEAADAPANGDAAENKAAKPKEFIREPPKGPKNDQGAWRRGGSTPKAPASPKVGEKVEDDGWSTVATARKGGKGRGGARAAA